MSTYLDIGDIHKVITSNTKEIFPLLMEDLKQAGYTQVSFNVAGDKLPDYQHCNRHPKNPPDKDLYGAVTNYFHQPMAHYAIFVYPFIESDYSHTHSKILNKYGLTWGGGDNNMYAIKPEFATEIGSCVFDLVDGRWKRQPRRYGKRFIQDLNKHVTRVPLTSSDEDIKCISRIYGFYEALVSPISDLPLYISDNSSLARKVARMRMGHYRGENNEID
jgi:hypothetical protein